MERMCREDLEELITELYCDCIAGLFGTYYMDYLKLPCEKKINIVVGSSDMNIGSQYINVEWCLDNMDLTGDRKLDITFIKNGIRYFSDEIYERTRGRLRVTGYTICEEKYMAQIHIENIGVAIK